MFVCFGMRGHEVEGQPYRIGAVGSGYVFHETMSDAVVHPIGNVVQAGSVTVDFAIAIADALQGACIVGIVYRAILDGRKCCKKKGLIDSLGGLSDALDCLYGMITKENR